MSASQTAIPYEKQADELTGRACGATCLSMVYRSLGKEVPQTEIWPVIAKANRFGAVSSTTYLMAKDAVARGFSAIAFQARHPLQVLRLCRATGVRAILNHRVQRASPAGHYSVLVDIDNNQVVVHDPLFGPARPLSHSELLELWLPQSSNTEIAGAVVIAIAPLVDAPASSCEFCHAPMPRRVDCPNCKQPVGLEPSIVMGCVRDGCIARMWNWVCCPSCDYAFTFKDGAPAGAASPVQAPAASPSAAIPGLDVAKLFGDIDKFTNHILSVPQAANNPDVKKQLEAISAGKERFKVVHAEDNARRAATLAQLSGLLEKNKQQREAQQKIEQENNAAPSLDGNALHQALLKNLGFK
jgi:hypothetical protein